MQLAILCSHCGSGYLEDLQSVWTRRGLLYLDLTGTRSIIGCQRCVRRQVWKAFLINAATGWWSYRGIFLNVFTLSQNLVVALRPGTEERSRAALTGFITELNMPLEELEIGADGLTKSVRDQRARLQVILHEAILADGVVEELEVACAAEVLRAAYDDTISEQEARALLLQDPPDWTDGSTMSYESRFALLERALMVVVADGLVTPDELAFVRTVGDALALPEEVVERAFHRYTSGPDDAEPADDNIEDAHAVACRVLQLEKDAGIDAVKRRYRECIIRYHPDVATRAGKDRDEAAKKSQQITWAYDVMLQHVLAHPAQG